MNSTQNQLDFELLEIVRKKVLMLKFQYGDLSYKCNKISEQIKTTSKQDALRALNKVYKSFFDQLKKCEQELKHNREIEDFMVRKLKPIKELQERVDSDNPTDC